MNNSFLTIVLLATLCAADLYLHSPPGSNNRNRERKNNRNNANRLFDSQNNGQGGYPWRGAPQGDGVPDPVTYYKGSELQIEWTAQHACGANPNIHCELVVQYSCDDGDNAAATSMPGLRDGYPTGQCYDSRNENNGKNGNNCEASTCAGCTSTEHWLSRSFKSTNQNDIEGTNTIPDPTQQGANNLGGKTAAVRNAFYTARSITASANRGGANTDFGVEFGMHEDNKWYQKCVYTERNGGLYTSDQKLNKPDARSTRQNPNGARRGLECPEERDYYPYWRPTPWRDLAVLVSNVTYCDYFQSKSQNVATVGECECTFLNADNINTARAGALCPITQIDCVNAGFTWIQQQGTTQKAPDCIYHPFSRDNHLGNTMAVDQSTGQPLTPKDGSEPQTASYTLKIPEEMQGKCILRLRYNMSTNDYPSHQYAEKGGTLGVDFGGQNCPWYTGGTDCGNGDPDCQTGSGSSSDFACGTGLTANSIPLYNRPYVNLFDEPTASGFTLGLAINTHQTGRTFQDRSYAFNVADRPAGVEGRIVNLGLRGRRGNIVQSYPAVEYDFTPQFAKVENGDHLHIQLHGSDFNDNRNANNGEGWEFSDRTNIVESAVRGMNYPKHHTAITLMESTAEAKKWAWVGQDPSLCDPAVNNDNNQNAYKNCGKLNMAPNRFPQNPQDGLKEINGKSGTYYYYSTRNNNFSNRSHKSQIVVGSDEGEKKSIDHATAVAIAFGAILGVGLISIGAVAYMKVNALGCFAGSAKTATVV